ncbi:hypothetical protein EVG20_g1988 [Dentipellis fragilis]|uniref:F-box domain-containing protein n=1 Tax=Dentipellis fragilis TaxID=205917 RepID=A0A4Y9ZB19_9AGAM|nr:hypothetical protein EVG20_g1988 [Dentipellis fragilis]
MEQHARISRLPEEMLARIFEESAPIVSPGRSANFPTALIHITQVCRHWRLIALRYPRIWTHIPSVSAPWRSEFISRSRELPLYVYIKLIESKDMRPLHDMPVHRLKELTIHHGRTRVMDLESAPHCRPAPLLEVLDISTVLSNAAFAGPPFGGDVPRLQVFSAKKFHPDWTWLRNLHTITHLTIDWNSFRNKIPLSQLLDVLAGFPKLIDLNLDCVLPSPRLPDVDADSIRHVVFPYLQTLHLGGYPGEHSAFLSHISLNPSTRLQVVYYVRNQVAAALVGGALHELLPGSSVEGPRVVVRTGCEGMTAVKVTATESTDGDRVTIGFTEDRQALEAMDCEGSVHRFKRTFTLVFDQSFDDLLKPLLQVACGALGDSGRAAGSLDTHFLTSIDTVDLSFHPNCAFRYLIPEMTFWWMSSPWMGLVQLTLGGLVIKKFAQDFLWHTVEKAGMPATVLCLPCLQKLKLSSFDFEFHDTSLAGIVGGLKSRLKAGPSYVVSVEIRECGVSDDQVEELRDVLKDDFVWDGLRKIPLGSDKGSENHMHPS